ncbi:stress responsive protein [Paenibacillus sp. CCS19]|uniref:Dabb family protein n=1 Tax=Paenibacillus sp. CCS19 TaxID=3158387 RepID=UPI002564839C|nr:Dabb family protein [Paenibacillus cellulosilyticus]GMK37880.1 stress responsive protein [Paenibacillus cellulosilyticus]
MADQQSRIIHSVIFTLKHPRESAEAQQFLADGRRILSSIPSVEQFVVNLQVSPKNDYQYGFSMAFADQEAYEAYNNHPLHTAFVAERWETEVERFLEIDYVEWV